MKHLYDLKKKKTVKSLLKTTSQTQNDFRDHSMFFHAQLHAQLHVIALNASLNQDLGPRLLTNPWQQY